MKGLNDDEICDFVELTREMVHIDLLSIYLRVASVRMAW